MSTIETCDHTVTRGREGQTGSWCIKCGIKVLAVHSEPCGDCRHFKALGMGYNSCRHHSMRVNVDMRVTYWLVTGVGRSGLCFERAAAPAT